MTVRVASRVTRWLAPSGLQRARQRLRGQLVAAVDDPLPLPEAGLLVAEVHEEPLRGGGPARPSAKQPAERRQRAPRPHAFTRGARGGLEDLVDGRWIDAPTNREPLDEYRHDRRTEQLRATRAHQGLRHRQDCSRWFPAVLARRCSGAAHGHHGLTLAAPALDARDELETNRGMTTPFR